MNRAIRKLAGRSRLIVPDPGAIRGKPASEWLIIPPGALIQNSKGRIRPCVMRGRGKIRYRKRAYFL